MRYLIFIFTIAIISCQQSQDEGCGITSRIHYEALNDYGLQTDHITIQTDSVKYWISAGHAPRKWTMGVSILNMEDTSSFRPYQKVEIQTISGEEKSAELFSSERLTPNMHSFTLTLPDGGIYELQNDPPAEIRIKIVDKDPFNIFIPDPERGQLQALIECLTSEYEKAMK